MKSSNCVALFVTLACLVNSASATVITPSSASSSVGGRDYALVDSSGLDDSDPNVLNWTASTPWNPNVWESYNSLSTAILTFDLGGTYDLTQIYVWNYNNQLENVPGRQVASFDYEISSNGVDWSPAGNTGVLSTLGNSSDPQPTTAIAVSLSDVSHIRFRNFTNVSGLYYGLNEVRFESGAVPEPSSFVLAAFGLAGLGWFGFRRRKA